MAGSAGATLIPRVVVVGGAGTGKTTLSTCLARSLGVPLVEEGVREWLRERGKDSPSSMDQSQRIALQHYFLRTKLGRETCGLGFVSDRSVIDSLVLIALREGREGFAMMTSALLEHLWNHAKTVPTLIVLAPEPWKLDGDPVRPPTLAMRRLEHRCIEKLVVATGRPMLRLASGSTQDWIDVTRATLGSATQQTGSAASVEDALDLILSLAEYGTGTDGSGIP